MSSDITLSIVASYDDIRRCDGVLTDGLAEMGNFVVADQKRYL